MREHFEASGFGPANHAALSPLSFLRRAALVYASLPASSFGGVTRSWAEVALRVRSAAAGLAARGIGAGDTVSVLSPNRPELFELHYAVPMAGAVLNTVNTRLEPETIAYILDHSDSRLVLAETTLAPLVRAAFGQMGRALPVVDIGSGTGFAEAGHDDLVAASPMDWTLPADEGQAIALNYTSGTSGRPKGVVYHHRGACVMAMGTVAGWPLPQRPTYLSVVPIFHCNGWNHPWAMAIVGGHMIFAPDLAPETLLRAMTDHGVTHLGAAPVILQMLCESPGAVPFSPKVKVMTTGAPPPPAVLEKAAALGLEVMQVYGLTETYGHITQCLWQDDWADRAPADGLTQGEIAIRGNTVMKGYYKDQAATEAAFQDGWFWSGAAAVMHPDGFIQIRDRLKDVIISGGENASSVEVEAVLYRHPAIKAAAVVARPHHRWGEAPCAFVEMRDGSEVTEADVIAFCRAHLAGFKTPKSVVFQDLPKTATGKIQKFILRDTARALGPLA